MLAHLFVFSDSFSGKQNPGALYEAHLTRFITAFRKFGAVTPELELLGEAVVRLWNRNRQLAIINTVDELTGVLNRRGFFNAIRPLTFFAQRTNQNVGFLIADVDNFKKINDTFGHQKGDQILQAIGTALRESVRGSDIVGRYGGEEFIVFFTGMQTDSMVRIAEKIRLAVAEKTRPIVPSTISAGVASAHLEGNIEAKVLSLIKKADDSLYEAKRTGKNKVVAAG